MEKLEALASKTPHLPMILLGSLAMVVTPFIVEACAAELARHPDPRFRDFLLRGMQMGFRIGCDRDRVHLRPSKRNMASATEHPDVVQGYLDDEESWGRIGSVSSYPYLIKLCHVSPFGVIKNPSQGSGTSS